MVLVIVCDPMSDLRRTDQLFGRAAAFSPASIAGLQVWFKSGLGMFQNSNGTTAAVAESDPVGYWGDQSGNARHVIQATSTNRPLLKLAVRNGKPGLLFDGLDDYLSVTFGSALAQPNTVFVVADRPSNSTEYVYDGVDGSNRHALADFGGLWGSYAGATLVVAGVTAAAHLFTANFDGASGLFRVDGADFVAGNVGTQSSGGMTIGSRLSHNNGQTLSGYIFEFLFYSGTLSTVNRNLVEAYLNTEYALY